MWWSWAVKTHPFLSSFCVCSRNTGKVHMSPNCQEESISSIQVHRNYWAISANSLPSSKSSLSLKTSLTAHTWFEERSSQESGMFCQYSSPPLFSQNQWNFPIDNSLFSYTCTPLLNSGTANKLDVVRLTLVSEQVHRDPGENMWYMTVAITCHTCTYR